MTFMSLKGDEDPQRVTSDYQNEIDSNGSEKDRSDDYKYTEIMGRMK